MEDAQCVHFLQWALPRLNLRWKGFKKVRRQVCRRLDKRIARLGLSDIRAYRELLEQDLDEWSVLDQLCRVTISRFYRDRVLFDYLSTEVLSVLVQQAWKRRDPLFRIWSAGCASGEEPYTMALLWHYLIRPEFPDFKLEIIGTDIDPVVLERADTGCYEQSSLRELPAAWHADAFELKGEQVVLKEEIKDYVDFLNLDIRKASPNGFFHIILCRNLAFTYFDQTLQRDVLKTFYSKLEKGGVLICAGNEKPPVEGAGFVPWLEHMPVFHKQ